MEEPTKVLKRVTDPLLTYATDEDTGGPAPLARPQGPGHRMTDHLAQGVIFEEPSRICLHCSPSFTSG